MPQTVGWQAALPEILEAGSAVRRADPFDAEARRREVARRVREARAFPWWPPALAIVALALPYGVIWAAGVGLWWAITAYRAAQRGLALEGLLSTETTALRARTQADAEHLEASLLAADRGDRAALTWMLDRWRAARPPSIQRFDITLEGDAFRGWTLRGEAVQRDDIPSGIPRIGRGGRTVVDKRKAAEIDEDLSQLNAGAVLSVLLALFSGPTRHRVAVAVSMPDAAGTKRIPWVTLLATVNDGELQRAVVPIHSAVDGIVRLGGQVGRCRAQRLTPAADPGAGGVSATTPTTRGGAAPSIAVPPARAGAVTPAVKPSGPPSVAARASADAGRDPYGARASGVDFGVAKSAAPTSAPGDAVPTPPPGFASGAQRGVGSSNGAVEKASGTIPSPKTVAGAFSTVARRFASYQGDASARFVAFQAYWSTYAQMAPGQLKYYFKWRQAVRNGGAPRADLSYIFVHVYELLHLIGAENAADAGQQLERLWRSYRATFPKLDGYCARWISDLYATEIDTETAIDFVRRAAVLGAAVGHDEALLLADQFWTRGDYAGMPRYGVAALTADPRLGDNKFYVQHNDAPAGTGWVDRAYRDALAVADRWHTSVHGVTLRDATIAREGTVSIRRLAFQGAVYDWKQKLVVLGSAPTLSDAGATVQTFRNAVRYAENLLRKERGFTAKLRGVEVDAGLAAALDTHFGGYIRATKPKPKVVIDLARAKELARESADVRARLLEGIDGGENAGTRHVNEQPSGGTPQGSRSGEGGPSVPSASAATPTSESAAVPLIDGHVPPGLLTDLAAVQIALGGLAAPARSLLEALEAGGWELAGDGASLKAALGGALVGPLVDAVNERAIDTIGDILLVHEGDLVVVQEDYRDEVYWVLKGTLDGYGQRSGAAGTSSGIAPRAGDEAETTSTSTSPSPSPSTRRSTRPSPSAATSHLDRLDPGVFGPIELQALAIIADGSGTVAADLAALAAANATTPLILLDRINELALDSSHGDIVVDVEATPPRLLDDATEYVTSLLDRVGPLLIPGPATAEAS